VQEQVARARIWALPRARGALGELVTQLVPCAELVRFTMSGTEATHLAMRVARASHGRSRIVKFAGHFHGWHDGAVAGVNPPYECRCPRRSRRGRSTGRDLSRRTTSRRSDARSSAATSPRSSSSRRAARPGRPDDPGLSPRSARADDAARRRADLRRGHHGFRYSPGGAQAYFGVTPDLTTLAKIVAGGLPGGALCGRAD
jgi:glutamate-1-semialdehyde 2,1-aminomutase